MTGDPQDCARPETAAADGLVVVDKSPGWTSHDVVARIRRLARTRRVGHAGTLDPMATGVLVVGVGRATRLLGHLALGDKSYDATIRLGAATFSDDADGEVVAEHPTGQVSDDAIAEAVRALTGDILQVPSTVSAIKVAGRRSYALARAGERVELAARPVRVATFEVRRIRRAEFLDLDVSVSCSTGTYVRALARDLGAALGVGGHLTALRRTRAGAYDITLARSLEELELDFTVVPLADAVARTFPRRDITAEEAVRVAHGARLPATGRGPGPVGVFGPEGRLIALMEEDAEVARALAVFVS